MNDILLLSLAGSTTFFSLLILIKQWRDSAKAKQSSQDLTEALKNYLISELSPFKDNIIEKLGNTQIAQAQQAGNLKEQLQQAFSQHRERFDERQLESLKVLQDTLHKGVQENRVQVKEALSDYAKDLGHRMNQ